MVQKNTFRLPGIASLALLFAGIVLMGDATYRQENEGRHGSPHLTEKIAGGLLVVAGCAVLLAACRMDDQPEPADVREQRAP